MDISDIKNNIRRIIHETTNIDEDEIGDDTHFVKDLELDSLTLLEIGVSIDEEYQLDVPEEEMKGFYNLIVSAEMVMEYLEKKEASN